MKCSLCPRIAWYTVASRGYCDDHKKEAIADAKKEGVKSNRPQSAAIPLALLAVTMLSGCEKEPRYIPAEQSMTRYMYVKDPKNGCEFDGIVKGETRIDSEAKRYTAPDSAGYTCPGLDGWVWVEIAK